MTFNSLPFCGFILLLWPLYWLIESTRIRHWILLAASLIFYAWWDWRFVFLLVGITGISYLCSLDFVRWKEGRGWMKPSLMLGLAISLSLGTLGFFKYSNFLYDSISQLSSWAGLRVDHPRRFNIPLPIGISFFTFHALSYCIDVYRGHLKAERSFSKILLYIAFFPQLVAGPILRATDFLPQLHEEKKWQTHAFVDGLVKFVRGFIYKVVFADNLAQFCDPVFSKVAIHSNPTLVGAALAFFGQIYFDFAGYSIMAIGIAQTFGFHMPDNFRFPYSSLSVTEFWRRWHISLSTCLRDYLFIPLGGNRGPRWMYFRNIAITMLLGGLWHGASWNFVLWGALHGAALAVHKLWLDFSSRSGQQRTTGYAWAIFSLLLTQAYVALCWIPFRAESAQDTLAILRACCGLRSPLNAPSVVVPWALIFIPVVVDHVLGRLPDWRESFAIERESLVYALLVGAFLIAILCMATSAKAFIYFQF